MTVKRLVERNGTKRDRALVDDFRKVAEGKSPQRIEKETAGAIPSSTAFRYQQPGYYPQRMTTDLREAMEAYVVMESHEVPRGTRVRETGPDYMAGKGARLNDEERTLLNYIVEQFQNTEGMRRFAGHVSANGRLAGALDYAEERGASEAVIDALHEWGKQEARREKNRD